MRKAGVLVLNLRGLLGTPGPDSQTDSQTQPDSRKRPSDVCFSLPFPSLPLLLPPSPSPSPHAESGFTDAAKGGSQGLGHQMGSALQRTVSVRAAGPQPRQW